MMSHEGSPPPPIFQSKNPIVSFPPKSQTTAQQQANHSRRLFSRKRILGCKKNYNLAYTWNIELRCKLSNSN